MPELGEGEGSPARRRGSRDLLEPELLLRPRRPGSGLRRRRPRPPGVRRPGAPCRVEERLPEAAGLARRLFQAILLEEESHALGEGERRVEGLLGAVPLA